MITEAEAKKMWCPFARVMLYQPEGNHNPPVNRDESNRNCIGSACMAWRWSVKPDEANGQRGSLYQTAGGFCGLAGKP